MLFATWKMKGYEWVLRIPKDKYMLAPPLPGDQVVVEYKDGSVKIKYLGILLDEGPWDYFFSEDEDPFGAADDAYYDWYGAEDWLDD